MTIPRDEVAALKRELAGCHAQRPERAKEILAQLSARGAIQSIPANVETRKAAPKKSRRKAAE